MKVITCMQFFSLFRHVNRVVTIIPIMLGRWLKLTLRAMKGGQEKGDRGTGVEQKLGRAGGKEAEGRIRGGRGKVVSEGDREKLIIPPHKKFLDPRLVDPFPHFWHVAGTQIE